MRSTLPVCLMRRASSYCLRDRNGQDTITLTNQVNVVYIYIVIFLWFFDDILRIRLQTAKVSSNWK